ncbi:MAG: hypothetical protein FWD15_02240 [Alphaproteobacteria bacterium]|nr:hypothetical protein [Alphaproteobacteria bacterium]
MKKIFALGLGLLISGAADAGNKGAVATPGPNALSRATINSFETALVEASNACNNKEMRDELDRAIKGAGTAKTGATVATVGGVAGTGADVSRRYVGAAREGALGTATQIVSVAGHGTAAVGSAVAVGYTWGIPGAVDKIKAKFSECMSAISVLETFSARTEAGTGVSSGELDRFNMRVSVAREAASMFNQINTRQLDTAKSMAMATVGVGAAGVAASGTAGVLSGRQGYRQIRGTGNNEAAGGSNAAVVVPDSE